MATCNAICSVWILSIILIGTVERAHQCRIVEASRQVSVGATPSDVLAVLGPPTAEYAERDVLWRALLGPRPRQWMYGTTVNLRYIVVPELPCPNPLPINLRLSEYAADDLVIDWSPQNLVTNVKRPTIEVPPEADALLDALYFVDELVGLLLRSKHSSIDQAIDGNSQSGRE